MSCPPIPRSPRIAGGYKGSVGSYCCVPGCSNAQGRCKRKGIKLSFYSFPRDVKQNKIWLDQIGRDVIDKEGKTTPFEPKNHSRVCSAHFVGGSKSLSPYSAAYAPSIFPRDSTKERSTKRTPKADKMPKKGRNKVAAKRKYHYNRISNGEDRDDKSHLNKLQSNKIEVNDHQYGSPSVTTPLESVAVTKETNNVLTQALEQDDDHTYTIKHPEESSEFDNEQVSYECNMETDGSGVEPVEVKIEVVDVEIENETINIQSDSESFGVFAAHIRDYAELRHYSLLETDDYITLIKFYGVEYLAVKYTVKFDSDFKCSVHVHRKEIDKSHTLWQDMLPRFTQSNCAIKILDRLETITVCCGNPEVEYQDLAPIGSALTSNTDSEILAYREGDFGAKSGFGDRYISTIRSSKCEMLVFGKLKCVACLNYGYALKKRLKRIEERQSNGMKFLHSTFKHKDMTRNELYQKLNEQKEEIENLQQTVFKLQRQYNAAIQGKGMIVKEDNRKESQISLEMYK